VAEVKGWSVHKKSLKSLYQHLIHPNLRRMLKDKSGISSFEKWIYSWSLGDDGREIKKHAREKYKIKIKTFPELIKFLLELEER
jgi:hypothetical protein